MRPDHVWRQIEGLLATAHGRVVLVAPFIKKDVFKFALDAVADPDVEILCVTRWSVLEVAAGVSDPEIADLAVRDGRVKILLCHDLHAKLYIADRRCLVGSANLTAKATGLRQPRNAELLLEVPHVHPEVQLLLEYIEEHGVPASTELAHQIREQADLLREDEDSAEMIVVAGSTDQDRTRWRPETRDPQRLYRIYRGAKHDFVSEILAGVVRDLAYLDVPPGLDEQNFSAAVLQRLYEMPEIGQLITEKRLNMDDLQQRVMEADGCSEAFARRAAENIGEWLKYFDEVRVVPTGPWEIRYGRELR
ncbi:phospholipase D family protein [Streptomyces sp. NPDC051080]|uniref:phospholipase D family protein n=1 Tax=Streptomyces sp. NPDC051080 TaxID=3157222 RepID=UPI00341B474A